MRNIFIILIGLSLIMNVFIPVKAEQTHNKNYIGIDEASKELLEKLESNNINYNETTKIGITEVQNMHNLDEISSVLTVLTTTDGITERFCIWSIDEEGSVQPVKLVYENGLKSSPGYNVVTDSDSNAIFVGTTTSAFTLYVDGSNQYIRPISAAFYYHYNSGYSGTFNGTFSFYTYGPLYSYPSYSYLYDSGHTITITKNGAAQNTAYTSTNGLAYGYCFGVATAGIGIPIWGEFYGTAAGVSFFWSMNVIDFY